MSQVDELFQEPAQNVLYLTHPFFLVPYTAHRNGDNARDLASEIVLSRPSRDENVSRSLNGLTILKSDSSASKADDCLHGRDQLTGEEKGFKRAIDAQPNLVVAHDNLAYILAHEHNYLQAMGEIGWAIGIDLYNAGARLTLGDILRAYLDELVKRQRGLPDKCYPQLTKPRDLLHEAAMAALGSVPDGGGSFMGDGAYLAAGFPRKKDAPKAIFRLAMDQYCTSILLAQRVVADSPTDDRAYARIGAAIDGLRRLLRIGRAGKIGEPTDAPLSCTSFGFDLQIVGAGSDLLASYPDILLFCRAIALNPLAINYQIALIESLADAINSPGPNHTDLANEALSKLATMWESRPNKAVFRDSRSCSQY